VVESPGAAVLIAREKHSVMRYQSPTSVMSAQKADLFAVGVVLYQLLCDGHHPYPNSMPMFAEPVIDPRTIRSDL
jgi:hypothetical protein